MNKINYFSMDWLILKINNKSLEGCKDKIKGLVIDLLGWGTSPYKKDILKGARAYIGINWGKSFHDLSNVDVFADLMNPLPFKSEHADTIVSFQVMEHLPDPFLFLIECYRVLKSGGNLFITMPFMWHTHEAPYDLLTLNTIRIAAPSKKEWFYRYRDQRKYWILADVDT